ncbi:MAG: hypothetical protein ABR899_02485 [Candidatus Krumholzibacteriaceae bacterium]|jgi:hypothetical protein
MAMSVVAEKFTTQFCKSMNITRDKFFEGLVLDLAAETRAWGTLFPTGPSRILKPFPLNMRGQRLYRFLLADHIAALSRIPREPASKIEGAKP